jgi:hypothetical protein
VTVRDPVTVVLPIIFKDPLEYTKLADAVAAFVEPSDSNTLP